MITGRSRDRRRYMCRSGPDFGGCGGTMISATVEELVADAVLYRLDTPELAAAIDGRQRADETSAALSETIREDTAQLEELAGLYAAKDITAPEWIAARKPIEARLQGQPPPASQPGRLHRAGRPHRQRLHPAPGVARDEPRPTGRDRPGTGQPHHHRPRHPRSPQHRPEPRPHHVEPVGGAGGERPRCRACAPPHPHPPTATAT